MVHGCEHFSQLLSNFVDIQSLKVSSSSMHFSSCQIRFTTCPGRELESELSRTTCRNSPGSSNYPAGVPRRLSVGCPEDILVHRMYIPGNFRKQVSLRAHCSYHRPSEVIKMELGEAFLCLPLRAGFGGDVGT